MNNSDKIYVAGHRGMVGSAIQRRLEAEGFSNIVTRTSSELDLINQQAVADFFAAEKPEYVFLAAARVGGIHANNTYRGEFIYQNLMIQNNVIHQSYLNRVKKLLFLGSSCIYPKLAPQPMQEQHLMTGPLEPTNSPYAQAKIAGIEMCWAYNAQYGTEYVPVMPTNLYGPNDNYDLQASHVLPAMIRKFHLAKLAANGDMAAIQRDEEVYGPIPDDIKESLGVIASAARQSPQVVLWGSGTPMREFLYVDDLAEACLFVMQQDDYDKDPLFNIGTGTDLTIKELAETIAEVVGFEGEVVWNSDMPDGTPRKLLDVSRINKLGWKAKTGLEEGIRMAYQDYKNKID